MSNIQELFGKAVIDSFRDFAKADLDDVDTLEADLFAHIGERTLRRNLAETLYGARWIYKLGLALLVRDEEQLAHVRTQIVDYSSVCEGVLSAMILHGLQKTHLQSQKYQYKDIHRLRQPINWKVKNILNQISKQSFYWLIEVAIEENIVSADLGSRLHSMRKSRNTVHLRARNQRAFIGTSRTLFQTVIDTCQETAHWVAVNP